MAEQGMMRYRGQLLLQKYHAADIALLLRQFENDRKPHATFLTALNCLLVWAGARPATLPAWKDGNEHNVYSFIACLNAISDQLPHPRPAEIIVYERPQMYRSGGITQQRLITLRGHPDISFYPELHVEDDQIGRELGMYPPNTLLFAKGQEMTFSVWEAGLDALVYAERWDEHRLTDAECQEFLQRCQNSVDLWNETMKSLGLEYQFYGTMDWGRPDIPFDLATKTLRLFGKTHLGADSRLPTRLSGS
jgi:hypothetical protein